MITLIKTSVMMITTIEIRMGNLKLEEKIMFVIFNVFLITDTEEKKYLEEPQVTHWGDYHHHPSADACKWSSLDCRKQVDRIFFISF
jgi:hypothetical protein